MAQLQRMDAHLDTLSTELYQVKLCVGHIARRQVTMGGFASKASPTPLLMASDSDSEDKDDDDGDDSDTFDDDDGDALYQWDVYLTFLPFVTRDKKRE